MTVQACSKLAGVEAEVAGPRQGKEPKEVVGKAVGVARRGVRRDRAKVMFRGPGRSNRELQCLGNGI